MKAISIKQPWASLIAHGIKDIENRTWKCPQKYIGQRVLIHASKTTDENGWEALTREQLFKVIPYEKKLFGNKKELPHGDIIGSVVIADCVQNYPSIWAEKGVWNWVLKDAVLFDKPIRDVKGKLSFWEYNIEETKMNLNELRDKAYRNAVVHGWHEENLSDEHFLCLVISELMEAVEADRKGMHAKRDNFEYYMKQRKRDDGEFMYAFKYDIKDSLEDELSDACIRLLDLAGLRNVDLSAIQQVEYPFGSNETFTEFCFGICKQITSFTPERIGMSVNIHVVLMEIFSYCRAMGIDLLWFIEQKMKYNELRPYKHGNKSY